MPRDATAPALPLIIEGPVAGFLAAALADWIAAEAATLREALMVHGAILIRGADPGGPEGFEQVCRALTPELLSYVGGASPRTRLAGKVYTSTEYAAAAHLPLHIEGSYLRQIPRRIWFCCALPSADRGATPLGDMRLVRARLDPALVARFAERDVLYVTNLHDGHGFGKSWQQTYETDDRRVVEAHLAESGETFEWTADGGLRVLARQPGLRAHSVTGEMIWTNQAINWHPAQLGSEMWERMLRAYAEPMAFPKMAFYGDGGSIDLADVAAIGTALAAEEIVFDWRQGDVLVIDNEVIAHGRQPFTGARSIMVALA